MRYYSLQLSHSVVPNPLQPHELQHARPPCPSPTPGVYTNSCLLRQWCHPAISNSVVPFSSHLQSFPASGSFPISQLFISGGQSIGASASASVLPKNIQNWFPLGWTGWIPCSPRDSQESSPTPQFKSINSSALSFMVQLSHPYMTTGKTKLWLDGLLFAKYQGHQGSPDKIICLHFTDEETEARKDKLLAQVARER